MSAGAQNTDPELKKGHSTETNPGQDTGREDIDSAVRDRGLVDTAHAPGVHDHKVRTDPKDSPSAQRGATRSWGSTRAPLTISSREDHGYDSRGGQEFGVQDQGGCVEVEPESRRVAGYHVG